MIQLNYLDKSYVVPSKPMELTVDQYVDLYCVIKAKTPDQTKLTNEQVLSMISISTKIPVEVIGSMSEVTLSHLLQECHGVLTLELPDPSLKQGLRKEPFSFSFNGEKYLFHPSYPFCPLKHVRRLEDFLGEGKKDIMEYLHYVMAFMCYQEGEVFDQPKLNDKAFLLKEVPLEVIYDALFSFVRTRTDLLMGHEQLFKGKKKQTGSITKTTKDHFLERWGWYHIMNRLIERGRLASTIPEMDQMTMVEVFEHLTYLHDVQEIEEIDAKKNKTIQRA